MGHQNKRFQVVFPNLSLTSLLPSLSAGFVIGILLIFIEISLAAMIFSGPLVGYVSQGIGIMLFGLALYTLLAALFSSFGSTNSPPQDAPVAILSVMAAVIAGSYANSGDGESMFLTVLATIVVTTLLTGITYLVLGFFRLGNLVRYITFPVVSGFLAGTGWLLITGSIGVMVDVPLGLNLFQSEVLLYWLPGLLFAIIIFIIIQFDTPFWTLPALVGGGILAFYLFYFIGNGEIASAEANGWLLGPFPAGSMWRPHLLDALTGADWALVWGQLPSMGTVVMVSVIASLLNVGALSVAAEQDVDVNHELRLFGVSNILGALTTCTVGYTAVSISALSHRLSEGSRLVNLVVGGMAAFAVVAGASFLNFFPRLVTGGFLLFIGMTFIQDWLISARRKVSVLEYGLMWLIVLMVIFVGYLEAVFVGIIISTLLFAVKYSRIQTTRLAVTAESYQSQVQRPPLYQQLLKRYGNKLQILSLQGYIFFGIGDRLVDLTKTRVGTVEPEYMIFDFRLVTGIDSSAMLSFAKIGQFARRKKIQLVFTGINSRMEKRLRQEAFGGVAEENWLVFPELDMGIAWCEERLIEKWEKVGLATRLESLRHQWFKLLKEKPEDQKSSMKENLGAMLSGKGRRGWADLDHDKIDARFAPYLEQRMVEVGETIVSEEDNFGGLILIETGEVVAQIINMMGEVVNIRIVTAGNIIGEIGQYADGNNCMAVLATEPSEVFLLSSEKINEMETADPAMAIALHRLIVRLLSEKNIQLDLMVEAFQI